MNETIPVNVKENNKSRNYKNPRPQKGITEGHTHDRRSGTGRQDRPRKEGGGRGNVGNVKDEMNKEKYVPTEEQTEEVVEAEEKKPEEPEKMTLDEYYKSKGVDINDMNSKKDAPKKNEVNAEWIKKEKLTLMNTKEDEKKKDRNSEFNKREFVDKVGLSDNMNADMLGFTTKPKKQERKEDEPKENHHKNKKNKGQNKVVLNDDDFPAL